MNEFCGAVILTAVCGGVVIGILLSQANTRFLRYLSRRRMARMAAELRQTRAALVDTRHYHVRDTMRE